ncbi:putative Pentatricopeptide repeat-containing protein [Zostera marina]|uniref:Putative Pentatricopeptide repeat-containing protein n=1 Tax=Zostera marina TaxID=29655 RepID=A0A0K9P8W8_ZOSMR|nr:putative Pentatricopeptide repeat-containing protein [Zostera marina]
MHLLVRRYHNTTAIVAGVGIGYKCYRDPENEISDGGKMVGVSTICELLRNGGRWDGLNASCNSIPLSDSIIQNVLDQFKHPVDARKGLLFFHWCSRQRKYRHGLRTYCIMVHILVRGGSIIDATALMESAIKKYSGSGNIVETLVDVYDIVVPGPQVFDIMLQSLSKLKMFDQAIEACHYLREFHVGAVIPCLATFNSLLHSARKSENFNLVWKIYRFMVVNRIYPNQATVEIMINALCKEGRLRRIVDVLDMIHGKRCGPNIVVNTALILRIIDEETPSSSDEAIMLLKRMLQKNLILDDIAHSLTIHSYCKMRKLETSLESFDEMRKRGHTPNPFVYNSLIALHCIDGRIEDANELMEEMLVSGLTPYDETYNSLIKCSARMDRPEHEILGHCRGMIRRGLLPSRDSCNRMLGNLCENRRVEKANKVLTVLLDRGFVPDEVSYSKLVQGYGKIGNSKEIFKLYYEMEGNEGLCCGFVAYCSLITALCRCGKVREAQKIATLMKHKNIFKFS